ncbi:MAG: site-2 protease family protein [Coriobacteriaceae bacterium]|nr:site-2 protease family protein [Coriobacteriaceae bacterium]
MNLLSTLPTLLLQALALVIGIVVHESAHALAAYLLGDRTARERGRISLNPLAHIDPFGTLILPLIMLAAGGPVFAFAKPVPVHLGNLKHPKRDELIVALAGPASNILLAALSAAGLALFTGAALAWGMDAAAYRLGYSFFIMSVVINLSLAFFNLIPLPPLDGSTVLVLFLKGEALNSYYRIQRYAMPILIAVLYLLPTVTGVDLIGSYFDLTVYPLADLLVGTALGAVTLH